MTATAPVRRPALRAGYREREEVRLLVAESAGGAITHSCFADLGSYLQAGDVLLINVSATVPAAVDAQLRPVPGGAGPEVRLHFSSPVAGDLWTVEPRRPLGAGTGRWLDFPGGELLLEGGAVVRLLTAAAGSRRLWYADASELGDVLGYLHRHGAPIRYAHEDVPRPLSSYQTVFASQAGSAEMPSAGRPFTAELVASLAAKGVVFAPLVLHTGVASFEAGERPDAERYRVPEATAEAVNTARAAGRRVVAVGTSSVRAIETVADSSGLVHPGSGVTDLLIGPQRGTRVVRSMISGWHDSGSSHLDLLAAVTGRELLAGSYQEAEAGGYLAHEFGDSFLILGSG